MSEQMTQEHVNEVFALAKTEWEEAIKKSGLSEAMFIAKNEAQWATTFLAGYEEARKHVESLGLIAPVISEGLSVTVSELDEDTAADFDNAITKSQLSNAAYAAIGVLYHGEPLQVSDVSDQPGIIELAEKQLVEIIDGYYLLTDKGIEVFQK